MGNGIILALKPEITPSPTQESKFDPLYGFPKGRKERKMIATEEEMISAKLPYENRDYCAHLALQLLQCRKEVWPWTFQCSPEKHEYLECQYEDWILRMKEYERERRLMVRKKRLNIDWKLDSVKIASLIGNKLSWVCQFWHKVFFNKIICFPHTFKLHAWHINWPYSLFNRFIYINHIILIHISIPLKVSLYIQRIFPHCCYSSSINQIETAF